MEGCTCFIIFFMTIYPFIVDAKKYLDWIACVFCGISCFFLLEMLGLSLLGEMTGRSLGQVIC